MTDRATPNALLGYDHTGGDLWPLWMRHLVTYLSITAPDGCRVAALAPLADKTSGDGFSGDNRPAAFERMRLRHLARCISRAHAMGSLGECDSQRTDVLALCESSFKAIRDGDGLARFNLRALYMGNATAEAMLRHQQRFGTDRSADIKDTRISDRILFVVRTATWGYDSLPPLAAAQATMELAGLVLGFANDEARRNAEQAEALILLRGLSDDYVSLEATND